MPTTVAGCRRSDRCAPTLPGSPLQGSTRKRRPMGSEGDIREHHSLVHLSRSTGEKTRLKARCPFVFPIECCARLPTKVKGTGTRPARERVGPGDAWGEDVLPGVGGYVCRSAPFSLTTGTLEGSPLISAVPGDTAQTTATRVDLSLRSWQPVLRPRLSRLGHTVQIGAIHVAVR